jgi:hypothetical protein
MEPQELRHATPHRLVAGAGCVEKRLARLTGPALERLQKDLAFLWRRVRHDPSILISSVP